MNYFTAIYMVLLCCRPGLSQPSLSSSPGGIFNSGLNKKGLHLNFNIDSYSEVAVGALKPVQGDSNHADFFKDYGLSTGFGLFGALSLATLTTAVFNEGGKENAGMLSGIIFGLPLGYALGSTLGLSIYKGKKGLKPKLLKSLLWALGAGTLSATATTLSYLAFDIDLDGSPIPAGVSAPVSFIIFVPLGAAYAYH